MKVAFLALLLAMCASSQNVTFVRELPGGDNSYYPGNRAPLAPSPLQKLPIGAIRPEGWLRHQLELMATGFSGRLEEISPFCKYKGNAWVTPGGQGERGWEEVPYWLKGFTDLGLVLGDQSLQAQARKWLDAVLANQSEDGYFGNRKNLDVRRGDQPEMNTDKPTRVVDLWPNMIMLYPLRSLYEATGDKRVLPFMTKYFEWQMKLPVNEFLPASWQKYRGGDNLDSIYWLYNRTGDAWLLDLAKRNHERTANWMNNIPTWHGVNISQGFREPAQFFQQAKDVRFLQATEADYDRVMGEYGQVPGGMFAADENARPGHMGPRQAAETCSMAEFMLSHEMLTGITGDAKWADRAEDVAFNSLPAAMTPDLKGLHYLTAPNMIQLDRQNKAPILENSGDMLSYNPFQYRCCQHNVAHAWPYFAEHLWMATKGNGLAAVMYSSSVVKAKVGDGTEVRITESTGYPFEGSIRFDIATPKDVSFPLALRVPEWSQAHIVRLNGKELMSPQLGRGWLIVNHRWQNGDRLQLELPMRVMVKTWPKNGNSVSIYRGPLAFSARIGERWEQYGDHPEWPAYEVFPATPWNWALAIEPAGLSQRLLVRRTNGVIKDQPFTPENAPVEIFVRARQVPQWTQESNGMPGPIPQSPVATRERIRTIALIPMGCARLRISVFPVAKPVSRERP